MIDIVETAPGLDLGTLDTQTERAANILRTQLNSLEYAPGFGIDLKYFLSEDFKFQNESFQSYCIQVLANEGINVSDVSELVEILETTFKFNLAPSENSTALVAR